MTMYIYIYICMYTCLYIHILLSHFFDIIFSPCLNSEPPFKTLSRQVSLDRPMGVGSWSNEAKKRGKTPAICWMADGDTLFNTY